MSKAIAGLIGPTLLATGAAMLINARSFPTMAEQISHDPGLIFVSGILLLAAGIAIVRVHNIWTGGWAVLVTALGWLAVVGGLVRMFFPIALAKIAARIAQHTSALVLSAIVVLGLGAFLSRKAYGRKVAGWS